MVRQRCAAVGFFDLVGGGTGGGIILCEGGRFEVQEAIKVERGGGGEIYEGAVVPRGGVGVFGGRHCMFFGFWAEEVLWRLPPSQGCARLIRGRRCRGGVEVYDSAIIVPLDDGGVAGGERNLGSEAGVASSGLKVAKDSGSP